MKRFFSSVVAVIVSAIMLVGCGGSSSSYVDVVPENAILVSRVDANQLLQKSGAYDDILRMAKAAMISEGMPESFVAIADDPANSGIDIQSPVYMFIEPLNMDSGSMYLGVVAKMQDKQKLDAILDMLQYKSRGEFFRTELNGITFMRIEEEVGIAYNDEAIIFGALDNPYNDEHIKLCLTESLNRVETGSTASLPGFDGSDAACRINMQPILAMLKMQQRSYYDSDLALAVNQLEAYSQMKVDMALNFANGTIDFDLQAVDMPAVDVKYNACTNDNLQYVPADVWAMFNSNIVGSEIIKALNTVISQNANLKSELNEAVRDATDGMMNFSAVMAIAEPLINSIEGDMTVALNGIDVVQSYYGEDYKPSVSAILGVNDSSIFNQISGVLEATGQANKVDSGVYSMNVDGISIFLGQQQDYLFLATSPLMKMPQPATKAPWYADVEDGYCYGVLNVEALMGNYSLRDELSRELRYEFGRSNSGYIISWMDAVSYVYMKVPELGCAKASIVFKNKEKNSLQLLVDAAKYDIIKQLY